MQHDLVAVKLSPERGRDGSFLRGLFALQLALEHAQRARQTLAYALGILGMPLWLSAARPFSVPGAIRSFALAGWAACFLGFAVALVFEMRLRKKQSAFIESTEGVSQVPPSF